MKLKQSLLILVLSTCFITCISARELPGLGIKTQAVQSPIKEETFQTLIIDAALKALGYDTQPILKLEYRDGYAAIANGKATHSTTSWYPIQNSMYKNAGGKSVFYRQGHFIKGASQGYLIDKKTADKYNIDNIEDLKDPDIAKLFDSNNDGKADMVGCQKGWGCADVIEHQLDTFGLRDSISHVQGTYSELILDTIKRYESGKPIIYYTWTPYWVSGILKPTIDVIWLQVPFSANPNGIDTVLANGKNYGFRINSERIVSNQNFAKANPAAAKLFEVAHISINDVSVENRMIANGEDSDADIQRHANNWIKANKKRFDRWVNTALKVSN